MKTNNVYKGIAILIGIISLISIILGASLLSSTIRTQYRSGIRALTSQTVEKTSILIENETLIPLLLRVSKGDRIMWHNKDQRSYNLTCDDTSSTIIPFGTYEHTWFREGTYQCSIETDNGIVIVE